MLSVGSVGSCVSVYGVDPIVIKGLGTPVSAQTYFNWASASPTFNGFGPWQGPAVTPASLLNPPATQGQSWGATPTGSPVATYSSSAGGWLNPNGGQIAFIGWENTIYSLASGTYYWSTITGYVGTSAPSLTQSGGSYGSVSISTVSYYDLALYLSGGCAEGGQGAGTTTTSAQSATSTQTQTSAFTSVSTASTPASSQTQTTSTSQTTVSTSLVGASKSATPTFNANPMGWLGIILLVASGFTYAFGGRLEKEES